MDTKLDQCIYQYLNKLLKKKNIYTYVYVYVYMRYIRIYCIMYILISISCQIKTSFHFAFETRAYTYVRRRQVCVSFRFDEHDLVVPRGPFNGISVLREREILNSKTLNSCIRIRYRIPKVSAEDATVFRPTL